MFHCEVAAAVCVARQSLLCLYTKDSFYVEWPLVVITSYKIKHKNILSKEILFSPFSSKA